MQSTVLARVRELQNMTRAEVCAKAGLPKSTLESYERKRRFPQPVYLAHLAEAFEMSVETLYRELCIDFGIIDRKGRALR